MCRVLRETNGACAIERLAPLFTDKRIGYWGSFAVVRGESEAWRDTRLCDEAAATISADNADLRFTLVGQYADLDRQIEVMRRQLARRKR